MEMNSAKKLKTSIFSAALIAALFLSIDGVSPAAAQTRFFTTSRWHRSFQGGRLEKPFFIKPQKKVPLILGKQKKGSASVKKVFLKDHDFENVEMEAQRARASLRYDWGEEAPIEPAPKAVPVKPQRRSLPPKHYFAPWRYYYLQKLQQNKAIRAQHR